MTSQNKEPQNKEPNNHEKILIFYEMGKKSLENGQYKISIVHLESAKKLADPGTRLGAEIQILLVTAFQAVGKREEAIALCQELTTHPNLQTRQKAKEVLYIIQAPKLQRPSEWMSEIPALGDEQATKIQYVAAKKQPKKSDPASELPQIDPAQVETNDNQFIWFALIIAILTIGSLIIIN